GTFENDYRFENYLEDALSAIKKLKEYGFIDEKNVFVWGHSMGGQLGFWVAHKDKSVKAICSVSAPTGIDQTLIGKEMEKIKFKNYYEKQSKRQGTIRIPYEFFKNRKTFDLEKILNVIKQPKLIIWGTIDTVVEPNETEKLFNMAKDPKEKLIIEGMGHDYKKYPELIEKVNARVIEFFSKQLK
ncbi:MAG: prolyl oligopeptidase family serine peptidase, partial [archaeon]